MKLVTIQKLNTTLLFIIFAVFSSVGIGIVILPFFISEVISAASIGFSNKNQLLGLSDYVLYILIPILISYFIFRFMYFKIHSLKYIFLITAFFFPITNIFTTQSLLQPRNIYLLLFVEIYVLFLTTIFTLLWKRVYPLKTKLSLFIISIPLLLYSYLILEGLLWNLFYLMIPNSSSFTPPFIGNILDNNFTIIGTWLIEKTNFSFDIFFLDWGGYVIIVLNTLGACIQLVFLIFPRYKKSAKRI